MMTARKKIDVFIEILIIWLILISSFSKKKDCIRTKGRIIFSSYTYIKMPARLRDFENNKERAYLATFYSIWLYLELLNMLFYYAVIFGAQQ